MSARDEHFIGARGERWLKAVGPRGDAVRQLVVNRVVAVVLDHYARPGSKVPFPAVPRGLIQRALEFASNRGPVATTALQDAFAWQDDTRLGEVFPGLQGSTLWDLGAGNGYLGRWLAPHGVNYVGVEPSEVLVEAASKNAPSGGFLFEHTDAQGFVRAAARTLPDATLVCLISVLDHLADPTPFLQDLAALLTAQHAGGGAPVLVATLDPSYFAPLPPRVARLQVDPDIGGGRDPVWVRDPAEWELLFANTGYHLLEQRPFDLCSAHDGLAKQLRLEHRKSCNAAPILTPPGQGPFVFWLLWPRKAAALKTEAGKIAGVAGVRAEIRHYRAEEPIAVVGNLGSEVYTVERGRAVLDGRPSIWVPFDEGSTFGQMELNQNFVSSRILGRLSATTDTRLQSISFAEIRSLVHPDSALHHNLLVGLLDYLSDVRFDKLLSARRVQARTSAVLGGSASLSHVRNFAGTILQAWSDRVARRPPEAYQSRMVLEVSETTVKTAVFQDGRARRQDDFGCIPLFVQNNIIDCFSASIVGEELQDSLGSLDWRQIRTGGVLHLGLLAALRLDAALNFAPDSDEDRTQIVEQLGLMISSLLGHVEDEKTFRRDNPPDQRARVKRRALPHTKSGIVAYVTEECRRLSSNPGVGDDVVERFLDLLSERFPFRPKNGNYQDTLGLSELIIVRDIWALLACVLDDDALWKSSVHRQPVTAYVRRPEQRPRMTAYFYECISYLACKAGLPDASSALSSSAAEPTQLANA